MLVSWRVGLGGFFGGLRLVARFFGFQSWIRCPFGCDFFLVKQTRPFLMRKKCSAAGKIIIVEVFSGVAMALPNGTRHVNVGRVLVGKNRFCLDEHFRTSEHFFLGKLCDVCQICHL